MGLRLIYGRAGCGKSIKCVEEIKERLKSGEEKPLILVVPEQFSFQAEKSVVEAIKGTGIINVEVTSFERIAFKVFNEVGGATINHMDSSGKSMLIFSIMNRLKEELKLFGAAADQHGFVSTVSEIITELKRHDITPGDLQDSLNHIDDDGLLKDKISDISKIFAEFEENLHKSYIDSEDELTMLYNKLNESTQFDGAELWFDEFSSFTPQQYKIIERLLGKAKRVNITLCMDLNREIDSTDVFAPIKNTEQRLKQMAEDNKYNIENYQIPESTCKDRYKDSRELKYLEANYFRYPYEQYREETEDIKIIRGLNQYDEVEKVAVDIIKMAREGQVRFRDIAVITRDLGVYEKIVKTIFHEYEIPSFIDKKHEIDDNPLIILITSALDIFNKNWSYETMFRYLKSGLINIPREEIDILENYVMAYGVRGKSKWNIPWEYGDPELHERINAIKLQVVTPLNKLGDDLKGKKDAEAICTAIYNFLCEIGANKIIESWVERFKAEGDQVLAREYSQIWNMVIELLDQVVDMFKEEKLELKEFTKILSLGFGEHKMGLIPPSLDQVLVSDVKRVRTHEVKLLYIVGVNDGIFPAVTKDEGILSDSDRDKLRKLEIEVAENSKSKSFEEQYLIYRTLTITSKHLRVCYSIADFEGKALRPSIIVSRFKALFPKIKEEGDIVEGNDEESLEFISRTIPTFNKLVSKLRREPDEKLGPLWSSVFNWYEGKFKDSNNKEKDDKDKDDEKQWQEKLKHITSAAAYTNSVEQIKEEKIRKLYGDKLYFSVSRIEKYTECPFAFYVQYGLKAKERRIFSISAPDLGTFIHSVIDEFSKTVDKNSLKWYEIDETWCIDTVARIVDEKSKEVSEGIFNSSPRYRYFTERLKRVLIKAILIIVEHLKRSGFQPIGYEMGFGDGETYPPIHIELSNGEKVKLIGRIDRVDKLELEGKDYYRIIDYKSGNKDFKLSDVYYGLQMQLLTYLDAILSNAEVNMKDPVIPGGVLYFKVDDPIIKGSRSISDEEIEKEIMKALKMKGLLIADPEVVREMDREIEGSSLIIPARINKDGNLGKSSVGTEEQFKMLREHVKENLVKACEDMLKGEIKIRPYKNKDSDACTYCMYSPICQFDESFEDNSYKIIDDKKDEEVWKLLEQEQRLVASDK